MDDFFRFHGRLGRFSYFKRFLILQFLVFSIIVVLLAFLGFGDDSAVAKAESMCAYPLMCISKRRFNDMNKSGWYMLLLFIPLINIITFIMLFFKKGTVGTNFYGVDPLSNKD